VRITQPHSERGLALLLVVSLLALVTLLVVSLAVITRVETQLSSTVVARAQARANALFALEVAVGQLQRYAGPDQRTTATSSFTSAPEATNNYTGVWDTNSGSKDPMIWLVSGNVGASIPSVPGAEETLEELVGTGLSHIKGDVRTPTEDILGANENVPADGSSSVGRFAWWVGDEGVKASIALADRSAEVDYGIWSTIENRWRLRQQLASSPTLFQSNDTSDTGIDPLDSSNSSLLGDVFDRVQLGLLRPVVDKSDLPNFLRTRFQSLTDRTYSVLANPEPGLNGGLMSDLSIQPGLLGDAFVAFSAKSAMEVPGAGNSALPTISDDSSPRRRYRIVAPTSTIMGTDLPKMIYSIAPVLTEFLLQFRVFRDGDNVLVRSRLVAGLWNPYTAALVPDPDLSLRVVSGLPTITITPAAEDGGNPIQFLLPGYPFSEGGDVGLPFDTAAETVANAPDNASWLPGRVYYWKTPTGKSPGIRLQFYNKNMNATGWDAGSLSLEGDSDSLSVSAPATTGVIIELRRGGNLLATYISPPSPGFTIPDTNSPTSDLDWKFAFGFRRIAPSATDIDRSWLTSEGFDPRAEIAFAETADYFNPLYSSPADYVRTPSTSTGLDGNLLFRSMSSSPWNQTYNNDVPLFELPRYPFLSVGELQHVQIEDSRPFSIGNSWGSKLGLNRLFDRFFFTGLEDEIFMPNIAGGDPLPNWNLIPIKDGGKLPKTLSATSLRSIPGGKSSRHLLQAGGFNINSTEPVAWQAVLSSMRFDDNSPLVRAELDNKTGSQTHSNSTKIENIVDSTLDSLRSRGGSVFLRFPQSMQETLQADDNRRASQMSTTAYRQGARGGHSENSLESLRNLSSVQVAELATNITTLIRDHQRQKGPFQSLADFLDPIGGNGGESLLEEAIQNSNLNPKEINPYATADDLEKLDKHYGFSSLTLTQADLVSGLAPYLKVRSDTFLVRVFGETINPGTGESGARSWCEVVIQRFPDTVNSQDDIDQPSGLFGRKFRIVSMRWLTSPEI